MTHHTHGEPIEDGLRSLAHELADALEAGDAGRAAVCWNVPGVVMQDAGVRVLASRDEVEAYCRERIEEVRLRGPGDLKLRFERVERLSEHTISADVIFSTPDGTDREPIRYAALQRPDGALRLCVEMPAPARRATGASDATLTGALEATFPASDPVAATTATTSGAPDERKST